MARRGLLAQLALTVRRAQLALTVRRAQLAQQVQLEAQVRMARRGLLAQLALTVRRAQLARRGLLAQLALTVRRAQLALTVQRARLVQLEALVQLELQDYKALRVQLARLVVLGPTTLYFLLVHHQLQPGLLIRLICYQSVLQTEDLLDYGQKAVFLTILCQVVLFYKLSQIFCFATMDCLLQMVHLENLAQGILQGRQYILTEIHKNYHFGVLEFQVHPDQLEVFGDLQLQRIFQGHQGYLHLFKDRQEVLLIDQIQLMEMSGLILKLEKDGFIREDFGKLLHAVHSYLVQQVIRSLS